MSRSLVFVLLLSVVSVAQANPLGRAFFGGGYSYATVDTEAYGEFNLGSLDIAGGMMFNDYLGFDARLGFGVKNDEKTVPISVLNAKVKTRISNYYGIYLRPQYQMGAFQAYGLFGYAGADVELEVEDTDLNDFGSDSGTSYGVGVGLSPDGSLFINLEYLNMISGKDYDFSGINLRAEFKL